MTWGRISCSANSRAAWRIAFCSPVSTAVMEKILSESRPRLSSTVYRLPERRRKGLDPLGRHDVDPAVVVPEDRVVRRAGQRHPVRAVLTEAHPVPPPAPEEHEF